MKSGKEEAVARVLQTARFFVAASSPALEVKIGGFGGQLCEVARKTEQRRYRELTLHLHSTSPSSPSAALESWGF